jgi:hypothetical protein
MHMVSLFIEYVPRHSAGYVPLLLVPDHVFKKKSLLCSIFHYLTIEALAEKYLQTFRLKTGDFPLHLSHILIGMSSK